MEVKMIITGKNVAEAEEKIQVALDSLGPVEIKFFSDNGMRVVIIYEEKKLLKGLTGNADTSSIGERTQEPEEVKRGQDSADNTGRSKNTRRSKKHTKPARGKSSSRDGESGVA